MDANLPKSISRQQLNGQMMLKYTNVVKGKAIIELYNKLYFGQIKKKAIKILSTKYTREIQIKQIK